MFSYQFRPIDNWPGPVYRARKRSTFRAPWSDTLQRLERELGCLGCRTAVIQADVDPSDLRLDGMLRANAKVRSPRVCLSFQSKHGPLSYPCDAFDHWQDNLRAIALALESLRAVDRYGVTKRAEQYKGWTKLPEPERAPTHAELVAKLALLVEWHIDDVRLDLAGAVKAARVRWHPDRHGGADQMAREVNHLAQQLGVK